MMSSVAWMVASVGSLPVTRHGCSCDALTRASETMMVRTVPVRFSYRASSNALAMLSGISATLGVTSPSSSSGLGGDVMIC